MGLFSSMTLNSLNDLLVVQLQDLYDAEQRLIKALPKMADAATNKQLKSAFQSCITR
jgi:ferritin-like metal-binding protein YciE